jgi:transcriptional regulator with PAS, ATPase and Fis domain
MVEEGLFREDLLYRINTIHVEVPPLREREGDIQILTEFFLKKYAAKYNKPGLRINSLAQEKLMRYPWPGNIRELQHTLERSVILSEEEVLRPADFLLQMRGGSSGDQEMRTLDQMEYEMITKALEIHDGNYSAAADQLGVSRQTLYNKLKKHKPSGS